MVSITSPLMTSMVLKTSESELPSLKNSPKESHGMPFSPNAQTTRMLIMCSECLRPRVLYSKHKLTFCEEEAVQRSIQNLLFSCGSNFKGITSGNASYVYKFNLFEHVFVRENITCDDCIEIPYYSSERFEDICIYCGCKVSKLVEGHYPLCPVCKQQGKSPVLKRKRKLKTN